jgi:hypothetical protein
MKLLDYCRQLLAIAAVLGGFFCASAAVAQPVIVGNSFSESQNKTDCGNVANCSMLIQAIPSTKTLLLRDVTCRVIMGAGGSPLALRSTGSGNPVYLPVALQATVGQDRHFISHQTVYQVATPQTMTLTIQLSAIALIKSMACTVAGDLF